MTPVTLAALHRTNAYGERLSNVIRSAAPEMLELQESGSGHAAGIVSSPTQLCRKNTIQDRETRAAHQ